jgi:predicted lipid carrier protein YhbT
MDDRGWSGSLPERRQANNEEYAMSEGRFQLPAALGKLLSCLPAYPGSLLFVSGLNLALGDILPPDVRQALIGRKLRLCVKDAGVAFDFRCNDGRFVACAREGMPELTIGASAHDFLLLARRQEDPDTLFFSRRLTMEGDTELGLLVKNTLDAIELPAFDLARLAPARLLDRLRND